MIISICQELDIFKRERKNIQVFLDEFGITKKLQDVDGIHHLDEHFFNNVLSESEKLFLAQEVFRCENDLPNAHVFSTLLLNSKHHGVPAGNSKRLPTILSEIKNECAGVRGASFVRHLQSVYLEKYPGMSLSQLEQLIGVSNGTFSSYASGKLEPTRGIVMSTCLFFELNFEQSVEMLASAGYCLCDSIVDEYFTFRIKEKLYGTYNFVMGMNDLVVNFNTNNTIHNKLLAADRKAGKRHYGIKKKPMIKLDKFFDTKNHGYTNGSISMCMDDGRFDFDKGLLAAYNSIPDLGSERDLDDFLKK